MIPTSTEIRHFIEIYHVRHVSKAALRLGVTQPTLTQSLKRLEGKLKTELFHRTKQGVVPTKSALLFYAKAKQLTEYWTDIEKDLKASATEIQGSFKVGCHPSVGAYTLPVLFKNIDQHAPKIEVTLAHGMSRAIASAIVAFEIDLGYVVNPPRHPDLILKKICRDRVTFWKRKGQAHLPSKLIADGNADFVESLLGRAFKSHFDGWSIVQSSSLELVRTLTLQGHGVGVLPERVALADNSELTLYSPNMPSRSDEIYLVYRRELLSSLAGRKLAKLATFEL